MSHIVEASTTVVHPNQALLREAVAVLAQQYSGEIKPYYLDYWGDQHPVNTQLALHIPRTPEHKPGQVLPLGLGLTLNEQTGALGFVGDPWGVDAFFQQMQQEIVQTYVSLATMAALKKLRYQTTTQYAEHGQILITGVRHV